MMRTNFNWMRVWCLHTPSHHGWIGNMVNMNTKLWLPFNRSWVRLMGNDRGVANFFKRNNHMHALTHTLTPPPPTCILCQIFVTLPVCKARCLQLSHDCPNQMDKYCPKIVFLFKRPVGLGPRAKKPFKLKKYSSPQYPRIKNVGFTYF